MSSPQKIRKELDRWLEDCGIAILSHEYTKRHQKLRITGGGKRGDDYCVYVTI